jgi:hypothetical protein
VRALLLLALAGCSLTYPSLESGEAAHVVVLGAVAYVALGEPGVETIDVASGRRMAVIPPPPGARSSDALAATDGKLFVLDARRGRLSVWSAEAPPRLLDGPVPVPVGPFSGVAAGGGRVIVSGGTSELTVLSYDDAGRIGPRATADLGRGQPDVSIAADGARAVVSTHFTHPDFGVTLLALNAPPAAPVIQGTLRLAGAGFTPGGSKPSNFPLVTELIGDRLFAAHGGGVAVVDVSRPGAPRLVRVVALEVVPVSLAADGDTLAVVGSSPAPRLVLLDARSLEVRRTIALPAGARGLDVALAPSRIVVAAGPRGALVMPR